MLSKNGTPENFSGVPWENNMEFKLVVNLFREASIKNRWGINSYIHLLDDGSGEVVSEDEVYDSDLIFEFFSPDDLIQKLEKSKK